MKTTVPAAMILAVAPLATAQISGVNDPPPETIQPLNPTPFTPAYRIIRLDPPAWLAGVATGTQATGINDVGQAAGSTSTANGPIGTVWSPQATGGFSYGSTVLKSTWTSELVAAVINNAGQVAGRAAPPSGEDGWARAFRYEPGVGTLNMGFLGENIYAGPHSVVAAINNNGVVVGHTSVPAGTERIREFWHAYIDDGTTMTDLGTFSGVYSRANDVNDHNQVVGFATYEDPDSPIWDPIAGEELHAALWLPEPAYGLPAGIHDLCPDIDWTYTDAEAINNHGQITIDYPYLYTPTEAANNFALWLPAPAYGLPAGLNEIGGFNGEHFRTTIPFDINDNGVVACQWNAAAPGDLFAYWQAAVWVDGRWFDLKSMLDPDVALYWDRFFPREINNFNEIVGWGDFWDGSAWVGRGFVAQPVPIGGDLTLDNQVDLNDADVLMSHFGTTTGARPMQGDLDFDGDVDMKDLKMLVQHATTAARRK